MFGCNKGLKYLIYQISVRGDTILEIDNRLREKLEKKSVILAIYWSNTDISAKFWL